MSKVHVLKGDNEGNYRIVIHTVVPAGNNSVGNDWSDVLVADGRNVSILVEGTGLGDISTAELADITSGDVIEFIGSVNVDGSGNPQVIVDDLADQIIADELAKLAIVYKYYGHTQNAQG